MNTGNVLIQFTFLGKYLAITNWTFVWCLFPVLIQMTFLVEFFITNWTCGVPQPVIFQQCSHKLLVVFCLVKIVALIFEGQRFFKLFLNHFFNFIRIWFNSNPMSMKRLAFKFNLTKLHSQSATVLKCDVLFVFFFELRVV